MHELLSALYSQNLDVNLLIKELNNLDKVYHHNNHTGTLLMHAVIAQNLDVVRYILDARDKDNQSVTQINKIVDGRTVMDVLIDESPTNADIRQLLIQHKAQTVEQLAQNTHDSVANLTTYHALTLLNDRYKAFWLFHWEEEFNSLASSFKNLERLSILRAFTRIQTDQTTFKHLDEMTIKQAMALVWTAVNDDANFTKEQQDDINTGSTPEAKESKIQEIITSRKMALFRTLYALQNEYGLQQASCPHGLINGIFSALNGLYPGINIIDTTALNEQVIKEINECIQVKLDVLSRDILFKLYSDKIEGNDSELLNNFFKAVTEYYKAQLSKHYSVNILNYIPQRYRPDEELFLTTLQQMSLPGDDYAVREYYSLLMNNAALNTDDLYNAELTDQEVFEKVKGLLLTYCQHKNLFDELTISELNSSLDDILKKRVHFIDFKGTISRMSFFAAAANTLSDDRYEAFFASSNPIDFIPNSESFLALLAKMNSTSRCDQLIEQMIGSFQFNIEQRIRLLKYINNYELSESIVLEIVNSKELDLPKLREFYQDYSELVTDEIIQQLQKSCLHLFHGTSFIKFLEQLPSQIRARVCMNTDEAFLLKYFESESRLGKLLNVLGEKFDQFLALDKIFFIRLAVDFMGYDFAAIINSVDHKYWEKLLRIYCEHFKTNYTDDVIELLTWLSLINPSLRLHFCQVSPNCNFAKVLNNGIKLAGFLTLFSNPFEEILSLFDPVQLGEVLCQKDHLFTVLKQLPNAEKQVLIDYISPKSVKQFIDDSNKLASLIQVFNITAPQLFTIEDLAHYCPTLSLLIAFLETCDKQKREQFALLLEHDLIKYIGGTFFDFELINRCYNSEEPIVSLESFGEPDRIKENLSTELQYKLIMSNIPVSKEWLDAYLFLGAAEKVNNLNCSLLTCIKLNLNLKESGQVAGVEITSFPTIPNPSSMDDLVTLQRLSRELGAGILKAIGGVNTLEAIYRESPHETKISLIHCLTLLPDEEREEYVAGLNVDVLKELIPDIYSLIKLPSLLRKTCLNYLIRNNLLAVFFNYDEPIKEDHLLEYAKGCMPQSLQSTALGIDEVIINETLSRIEESVVNISRLVLTPFYLLVEFVDRDLLPQLLTSLGDEFVSSQVRSASQFMPLLSRLPEDQRLMCLQKLDLLALEKLLAQSNIPSLIVDELNKVSGYLKQCGFNWLLRSRIVSLLERCKYGLLNANVASKFKEISQLLGEPGAGFAQLLTQALPLDDWGPAVECFDLETRIFMFREAFFRMLFNFCNKEERYAQQIEIVLTHPVFAPLRESILNVLSIEQLAAKLDSMELRLHALSFLTKEEVYAFLNVGEKVSFIIKLYTLSLCQGKKELFISLEFLQNLCGDDFKILFDSVTIVLLLNNLPVSEQVECMKFFKDSLITHYLNNLGQIFQLLAIGTSEQLVKENYFKEVPLNGKNFFMLHNQLFESECIIQFYQQLSLTEFFPVSGIYFIFNHLSRSPEAISRVLNGFPYEQVFGTELSLTEVNHSVLHINDLMRAQLIIKLLPLVDLSVAFDAFTVSNLINYLKQGSLSPEEWQHITEYLIVPVIVTANLDPYLDNIELKSVCTTQQSKTDLFIANLFITAMREYTSNKALTGCVTLSNLLEGIYSTKLKHQYGEFFTPERRYGYFATSDHDNNPLFSTDLLSQRAHKIIEQIKRAVILNEDHREMFARLIELCDNSNLDRQAYS